MKGKKILYILLLILLLFGLYSIVYGNKIRNEIEVIDPKGRLWIEGEDLIPPEGKRLTWGVTVLPDQMPPYWRFHIIFKSNSSVWLKAYWDNPNNTMIEIFGVEIDEVKYVKLTDMAHHKQWTWYIENQGKKTVSVKNFTVIYEGVIKPKESLGNIFMSLGFIFISIAVIISIIVILKKYFSKRQI